MISHDQKQQIVQQYGTHKNDSGSPQVQVAILTHRINTLKEHLNGHKHDNSSRRGLLKMVGARRKLLNYLSATNAKEYAKLLKALDLRKWSFKYIYFDSGPLSIVVSWFMGTRGTCELEGDMTIALWR